MDADCANLEEYVITTRYARRQFLNFSYVGT
jgi:hypothetical protein